jgi:hypothetical protein
MGPSVRSFVDALVKRFWKQSSTFRRLIFSQHVMDLQVIFLVTLLVGAWMLIWYSTGNRGQEYVGAVLVVCGTILAWTYQTGSKRLGVVDLFACEIVTLCRVGTIMEVVPRLIRAREHLSAPSGAVDSPNTPHAPQQDIKLGRFTSQENYFPVFEQNTKDLQVLEADVVLNVTAFYTYMKAFRDQLRGLSELGPGEEFKVQKSAFLLNAIYMLFLGYESARKSIKELIEFEPTQAEAMVTGLVTELRAYQFLTACFGPDDIRGRRLALRHDQYGKCVPKLYENVMTSPEPDWETARTTAVDLRQLYNNLGFTPKIDELIAPVRSGAS